MNNVLGFGTSWATQWSSAADFIAMGGYGLYVWGAFGVTALVVAVELLAVRARRKALSAQLESSTDPAHYSRAPHEA